MLRQRSPNYLRFCIAKSVTMKRHATHLLDDYIGTCLDSGGKN
jgi:hypothetical protein